MHIAIPFTLCSNGNKKLATMLLESRLAEIRNLGWLIQYNSLSLYSTQFCIFYIFSGELITIATGGKFKFRNILLLSADIYLLFIYLFIYLFYLFIYLFIYLFSYFFIHFFWRGGLGREIIFHMMYLR